MKLVKLFVVFVLLFNINLGFSQESTDQGGVGVDQIQPVDGDLNQDSINVENRELTEEEIQAAEDAAAAGCAVCGGGLAAMVIVPIIFLALNIALLIWVVRDSKARVMDSGLLWMILVFFTGPVGLVIYLFSRPQGELKQCESCKGKRLAVSAKCPHCQND